MFLEMFLYVGFLYKKRVLINNNAVFARVIDIYGPHFFLFIFFIYGPPVSFMHEALFVLVITWFLFLSKFNFIIL